MTPLNRRYRPLHGSWSFAGITKVLRAVHDFARKEFGTKYRYAMVLHTDAPHPHVHLVLKAVSEQGVRLNIHRATLQHWRQEFAQQLRARGVEANATSRSVRGQSRAPKGAAKLQRTRSEVVRGWDAVREQLLAEGWHQLADQVSRFVRQISPPRTEKEWLASELLARARSVNGAGYARDASQVHDLPAR